jgi:hypothetical protein
MKEFGQPKKVSEAAQTEKSRRAEIMQAVHAACRENRGLYFQGVSYMDTLDLRDAVVRSGRKFSELEIDRNDNEEISVRVRKEE